LVRAGVGEGVGFESELLASDHDLTFVPIEDSTLFGHQFLVTMPAMAELASVRQFFEIAEEVFSGSA
jgi:hypothetical protein